MVVRALHSPRSMPGELIQELFEQQVERTPHAVALTCAGATLSFAELNELANQIAWHLRAQGVGADQAVGLCVGRSLEMVVGILGILKAGGAYVPLEPAHPVQRLAFMLADCAPRVVLTHASARAVLETVTRGLHHQPMLLDLDTELWREQPNSNPPAESIGLSGRHLAYVIYTSGSTGQPKGVMVEHRNVISHWHALEQLYRHPFDCRRIGVNAAFTFDVSVQQIVQLLSGCTLFLIPEALRRDAGKLLDFIERYQIEGIDCTPSQLRAWVAAGLLQRTASALRTVLVGGESLEAALWSRLRECQSITFYNVYGTTECTVDSTAAHLRDASAASQIGRPLNNSGIYILDAERSSVAIGVVGEIYIAGAGVARGYLNRPDLTAERFLPDPFSNDSQAFMYRSGDLGRWCADGSIEYLGRTDQQLKIRGHRVELGEIEARLRQHDAVCDVAVLAREDSAADRRLVAYWTASDPQLSCDPEALREHMAGYLPDYMVPAAFVRMPSFPLTPSGKLDRRALPAPQLEDHTARSYQAPQGEIEQTLASIWQELLNIERVGRFDNFFDLGGHSLLVILALERVRVRLGLALSLSSMFEHPTLASLSNFVVYQSCAAATASSNAGGAKGDQYD